MESQSHQDIEEPIAGPCLSSEEDFMAQYSIQNTIGVGGFGQVNLAHHNLTGIPVAVKFLRRENQCDELIRTEVEVMKKLHHPNIINLIQVVETVENVYLAMELVQGPSLLDIINDFGCPKEHMARNIFRQLVSALCYCHEQCVAHRDIKPENIMVTLKGTVKLIDFGLSTTFVPGQMVKSCCGTPEYIPPECYARELCDVCKIDTWALGITLYFIMTGTEPFEADHPYMLMWKITSGIYEIPDHLSAALRDLISQMLTANPNQRPAVKTLRGHPWVTKGSPERSHYDDTMSTFPDPKIMAAMAAIGIPKEEVKDALLHKKYDKTQGIYQIFQARLMTNISFLTEPVDPGPTPWPSLSDPATSPLTPKHTVSMPSHQGSSGKTRKEMRNVRALPEYYTSQSCKKRLFTPNTTPQTPPTVPCNNMAPSAKGEAEKGMLLEGTIKEEGPLSTEAQPMPSAASRGQPRTGKSWARRIWRAVRNLCCCVPCQKRIKRRR